MLALSIIMSVCLLAAALLNSAGVFVASHIGFLGEVAVHLGFRAVVVFSVLLAIRGMVKRRRYDKAYLALAIQLATYAFLWSGVPQRHVETWNFNSRLARRTEVVELARNGKLPARLRGPCDCFYADLPKEYAGLSAGREILVSRHAGGFSVTFFVDRATWFPEDNYSAFVFRTDDKEPRTGEEDTYRFFEIRPLQKHWFFVRHT